MICKYCKQDREQKEFQSAGIIKGKRYYRLKCTPCKILDQNKRIKSISNALTEIKDLLVCNRCGFSDNRALQFHHTNKNDKLHNVSDMLKDGFSLTKIKEEISKCEVLCANCHQIHHHEERLLDK